MPHGSVVKSGVWKSQHKIEEISAHCQNKGLVLAIGPICRVCDLLHVDSDWIRPKMRIRRRILTHVQACELRKARENEADIVVWQQRE